MNITCKDYNPTKKPCEHYHKGCCLLPSRFRCIEHIKRRSPTLSYSYINNYLRCRRYFYYAYLIGLEPTKPSLPLLFGKLVHLYLDQIHSHKQIDNQPEIDHIISQLTPEEKDDDNSVLADFAMTTGLMTAYEEIVEPISGVVNYRSVISTGDYILKSIYDLYLLDEAVIYEFKYTQNPDNYTAFTTQLQTGIYFLTSKAKKIILRTIRKPALRKTKSETYDDLQNRVIEDVKRRPKHYITDTAFYPSEYNFDEIQDYISQLSDEIKDNIDAGIDFFYQNPNGCFAPARCEYLQICECNGLIPDMLYMKREIDTDEIETEV